MFASALQGQSHTQTNARHIAQSMGPAVHLRPCHSHTSITQKPCNPPKASQRTCILASSKLFSLISPRSSLCDTSAREAASRDDSSNSSWAARSCRSSDFVRLASSSAASRRSLYEHAVDYKHDVQWPDLNCQCEHRRATTAAAVMTWCYWLHPMLLFAGSCKRMHG